MMKGNKAEVNLVMKILIIISFQYFLWSLFSMLPHIEWTFSGPFSVGRTSSDAPQILFEEQLMHSQYPTVSFEEIPSFLSTMVQIVFHPSPIDSHNVNLGTRHNSRQTGWGTQVFLPRSSRNLWGCLRLDHHSQLLTRSRLSISLSLSSQWSCSFPFSNLSEVLLMQTW